MKAYTFDYCGRIIPNLDEWHESDNDLSDKMNEFGRSFLKDDTNICVHVTGDQYATFFEDPIPLILGKYHCLFRKKRYWSEGCGEYDWRTGEEHVIGMCSLEYLYIFELGVHITLPSRYPTNAHSAEYRSVEEGLVIV